jgi:hypothetical protein
VLKNRQTLVVIAIIALIAIYQAPTEAGGAVHDVFSLLAGVIQNMFTFTGAVMQ